MRTTTRRGRAVRRIGLLAALTAGWMAAAAGLDRTNGPRAAQPETHVSFDRVLDQYVRDGLVYYAALGRTDRSVIDRFLDARRTAPAGFETWARDRQIVFWVNTYNAIVVRTVLDHYPIRGASSQYPPDSIRQIPGAFERTLHDVAGRRLTLDQIEEDVLAPFGDPRVFLALGRGAVGSGRLRSEIYTAARLETQLTAVAEEFATEPWGIHLDRIAGRLQVNAIVGWREAQFVAAYADRGWLDSGRTPMERAVLNFIEPWLFPSERAFLVRNTFRFGYDDFDWRLNDLTGGRP